MPWTFGKMEFSSREKQHPIHDSNCIAVCHARVVIRIFKHIYMHEFSLYTYLHSERKYNCESNLTNVLITHHTHSNTVTVMDGMLLLSTRKFHFPKSPRHSVIY